MKILFRVLAVTLILPMVLVLNLPAAKAFWGKYQYIGPSTPAAARQIEYAVKHYETPNKAEFGYLGPVDCANYASQILLARGWQMDDVWWQDPDAWEPYGYSAAWVSSTALNEYLISRPDLARALTWEQIDQIQVGDIVMFDWDASGDRDHTAIVSSIRLSSTSRELLLTSHSDAKFNYPLRTQLGQSLPETKVYFWHLTEQLEPAARLIPSLERPRFPFLNPKSYEYIDPQRIKTINY